MKFLGLGRIFEIFEIFKQIFCVPLKNIIIANLQYKLTFKNCLTKSSDVNLKIDSQHLIEIHWCLNPIFVTPIRFKKPCFKNCEHDFEEVFF